MGLHIGYKCKCQQNLDWLRDRDMRFYRRFITSSCLEEQEFEAVLEEFRKHPLVKDAWTLQEVEAQWLVRDRR